MSIETVGNINTILKKNDAKSWAKDLDISTRKLRIDDAPKDGVTDLKAAKSFTDMLLNSMNKVNELQNEANVAIEKLAAGKNKNLHETMLAVEQADIAFKTMNQIRTKVIDAYKEVMRMQV